MLKVVIFSGSAALQFTGGETVVPVHAHNFRRMLLELDARYPGLGSYIENNMALAVDGEIFQDAYDTSFTDESQVCLIPKIVGG